MDCEIDVRGASHKPGLDYRSHDITAIDCSLRFMRQAQLFQEHKTLTNLPEGMSYRTQLILEAKFSGSGRLQKAGDIPQFLLPLRAEAECWAASRRVAFCQLLKLERCLCYGYI